jgi:putative transposase
LQKIYKPNEEWVTDITEFVLLGEKIYLSPMLDLYNGEIISYKIFSRPTFSLVKNMLEEALSIVPKNNNIMIHSE